jgi:hypothetical protein
MLTTQDRYSLQVFDRRSARTAAFDKAIRIYCDTTDGRVKTDASQIVYWDERKESDFSSKGDRVEVFGLLRDRTIIGFALGFHLPEQNLYVVDHMAITPDARSMTAFERFCDLIQGHVERAGAYIDYFVAEISADINDVDPLLNAETITRLLQIKGFRVVDCEYLTPSADRKPPYRPVKGRLLLHSTAAAMIAPSKLIAIVEAIHSGLYKNWYKPFADDFEKYCRHLREIQEFVQSSCGNKEHIVLNGHPPFHGHVEIKDTPQGPIALFVYLVIALALAIVVAAFASWMGIGLYSIVGGALAVAICMLVIMAIWYDPAARLVRYGIDALVSFSGRQK